MSLHQLYNHAVSTAILLLCTVYWTFLLCLQFCFPFLLYESRFCRFSLNFASLVFYLSEKVVIDCYQLSISNKEHESLFQLSVIAVSISLFLTCYSHRLLLFEFNSKLISSFYKAFEFVQFSSRSIELILKQFLNYQAEEHPCCIFFPRLLISSSSIILSLFNTHIMNCLAKHKNISLI